MFVVFNYRCGGCGKKGERFVRRSQMDAQLCVDCPPSMYMQRLPAAAKTSFAFADRSAHKQ